MVALITGATAGFGRAIAERFIKEGIRVVGVGRRRERLDELTKQFGADKFYGIAADVNDREALMAGIRAIPKDFADITILVNNAGLALGLEPAQKASLDNWDEMIRTNCQALVTVTHAILPGMVERGKGHIINMGSTAGEWPYFGANVYGATKAFVHQFSLNLRADLAGTPIRVTNIEPGLVGGTEFSNVRLGDDAKAAAVYAGTDPLMPDDIAEAAYWVVSLPAHVNINTMQMMPVCQSFAGLSVNRKG
ncbi:SDR family NAD(P)-dependent oxidoreductase [Microvirga sp. W0021]|uniref:SDR family NAD(P)-dependent oxidoreductase n=1 Tax=Hohaiivirga grylli TaxID=3133970 RepID=A0ABV0BMR1_9HYPH